MIIALSMTKEVCKIYTCGSVKPTEFRENCVEHKEGRKGGFMIQPCKNPDYACQAFNWNSPEQSTETSQCAPWKFIPTFQVPLNLVKNKGLDGDYCEKKAHCFSSAKNNASCTDNICTAATKLYSECSTHKDCPMGTGCNSSHCLSLKLNNTICENTIECGHGHTCVHKDGQESPTCIADFSWENGVIFVLPEMQNEIYSEKLMKSKVCKSGFQFSAEGKLQCRAANRNYKQGLDGRSTSYGGQTCDYITYNSESLSNFEKSSYAKSTSLCGFNRDSRAYCPVQPGDDDIVYILEEYRLMSEGAKCHKLSGEIGSHCASLKWIKESKLGFPLYKVFKILEDAQLAANVANNDKCVAQTITANFWHNNFAKMSNELKSF